MRTSNSSAPWASLLSFCILSNLPSSPTRATDLVRDINTANIGQTSVVALAPVDLANVTLFTLDDDTHGMELWATDGTPAGTRLVRDIRPGPTDSNPASFAVVNGIAYFWADDGTNGSELWRSDGTAAGTSLVANIRPNDRGVDGQTAPRLYVAGNVMFFPVSEGTSGVELWRSDGTASGTYRVKDINVGAASSDPENLTVVGSRLFFSANDGTSGEELWSSDGTQAGTQRVRDIEPGAGSSQPRQLTAIDDTLYFSATTVGEGREVWRATGPTDASMIQDFTPGATGSAPRGFIRVGATDVVFAAFDSTGDGLFRVGRTGGAIRIAQVPCPGAEPMVNYALVMQLRTIFVFSRMTDCTAGIEHSDAWTTDGTAAGTGSMQPDEMLKFPVGLPFGAKLADGTFLFQAYTNIPGTYNRGSQDNLWVSDGTRAGTRRITDFALSSVALEFFRVGDKVFFKGGIGFQSPGWELWASDGTTAGTGLFLDINPGAGSSLPDFLRPARGRMLFAANDGTTGIEPWISDGTVAGTQRLGNLRADTGVASSNPYGYLPLGSRALFHADDGEHGDELWVTDGTTAGTELVRDIFAGTGTSNPQWFVPLNGFYLFSAADDVSGRELWRTDGTAAGTFRVADILPGPQSSSALEVGFGGAALNGYVYFAAEDSPGNRALWRSDGTAVGTTKVFTSSNLTASVNVLGTLNGVVLFAAFDGAALKLWATDGTPAGTVAVANDLQSGLYWDTTIYRGRFYFQGADGSGDRELWSTDGTAAGTMRALDINPNGSSAPYQLQSRDGIFALKACFNGACKDYVTNGSVSALQPIDFRIDSPIASDGSRWYFIDSSLSGGRLATTDGTAAGSRLLSGTAPFSGQLLQLAWFGGALIFSVDDAAAGYSVWRSDGTLGGSRLLADVDPTNEDNGWSPGEFFALGTRLLFSAWSPLEGRELRAIDASQPNATDDYATTTFNTVVRVPVLNNDSDLLSTLNRASLEIVTPPGSGAATVDTASGEIVFTPQSGSSGLVTLRYRVKNSAGAVSNSALVSVVVTAAQGAPPGTAPTPPTTPPPTPDPPGSGGGGGGGGALDFWWLALLLALGARRIRRGLSGAPLAGFRMRQH